MSDSDLIKLYKQALLAIASYPDGADSVRTQMKKIARDALEKGKPHA